MGMPAGEPIPAARPAVQTQRRAGSLADVVAASRAEFVQVARSFWLIPELIPPVDRDAVAVLYCFCRRLDDAVDESPVDSQAVVLEAFRNEVFGLAEPRPLVAAFLELARSRGLPLVSVERLLEGMHSDLGPVRIESDEQLLRYCYRVSSAVGLLLAPLLGVAGPEVLYRVVDWGLALQLSNILLGVHEDAEQNRVYLPRTRLVAGGFGPQSVLRHPRDPLLRPVLVGLAELADRYYRSAEFGAAALPLRYRHGVILLGRAYADLGRRAARGDRVPLAPGGQSSWMHLLRLVDLFGRGLHPRVLGWVAAPPHDASLHGALDPNWLGVHR